MKNYEIAKILHEIAIFEEMKGEKFKPRAYEKAALYIGSLSDDLLTIYKKGGISSLMELPGIGKSIAEKLSELIRTGKLQYYEQLKSQIPVDVTSLASIEGIGAKTVKVLYEELGITNVEQLEIAAKEQRIRNLPGFGEKSEEQILHGIEFFKKSHGGRFILGLVLDILEDICNRLRRLDSVKKVELAGSARRMKESIGYADFLAVSDEPDEVMDFFTTMPELEYIHTKGITKSMVRLQSGIDCDLRIVPEESFGAALQYFTGNKQHNVVLRTIALHKGYKLNEYGLYDKRNHQLAGRLEEDIYSSLGLAWIPPELREDKGEIEVARKGRLPELIDYNGLRGDIQIHTNWTDGNNSIIEMGQAARAIGLEYIAITDHSRMLGIAHGLNKEKLEKQKKEIERTNQEIKDDERITILRGVEVNILKDGSLDLENNILKEFDVVGAAVHSYFSLPKKEQTKRLISAMSNPNVDILFHPTGRVIQQRQSIDVDIEKIIHVSKDTNTILEVDSSPDRLDLRDEYIKLAVENGCKLTIDSDAHDKLHLHFLKFGISQARRGWAEGKDVINTLSLEKFLKSLK
ncbi:MAG TPA: DNA polymerase/3'-5' exonuclease PolX [Candidatus Nitrosopolaris sp.]|nr:DNA polymerase/3'-5' exonuclease PolX [Candidatus Nitrosopolaris sp.]